jgi:site-specific DNA recombinase
MKERLKIIEEHKVKIIDQEKLKNELTLIVTNLDRFSTTVKTKLANIDWKTKRDIIKLLVKQIEINKEGVNIVFRINDLPTPCDNSSGSRGGLQHCPKSYAGIRVKLQHKHSPSILVIS